MTINRERLIELAADELNVTSVGQAIAREDRESIDGKIDSLLSNLAARGIINITDPDYIPDAVGEPLSILLAESCNKTFGKPRDMALRERMEEELRVIVRRVPATNKYLGVDEALRATTNYNYSRWLYDR